MAENNIGKITQIISAVIDIKFTEGNCYGLIGANAASLLWKLHSILETTR